MCGVIGIHTDFLSHLQLVTLKRLFVESKIRGKHSFGFTARTDETVTKKTNEPQQIISELEKNVKLGKPLTLIGHSRYSTSGDFREMKNNQPLNISGISLVFNGVISQADPSRWENFGSPYETANDGEILIKKIKAGHDWEGWIFDSGFSFAGLVLTDDGMIALRNQNRPLWIGRLEGATFFASTKDIFLRSGLSSCHEVKVGTRIFF